MTHWNRGFSLGLTLNTEPIFGHDTYLSPFTWRYGSPEMRALWSEMQRRRLWRRIWVALAEAEQAAGLVTAEQVADLAAHADEIDLARAQAIEAEIHHDLMAEVRTYAEQCPVGGGIIHLGATSMDIEDNADALRIRDALDLVLAKLAALLLAFAEQIERWADAPTMAFTHLQPAEPTTVGYRLAQYAQDLLADYDELHRVRDDIRGKGFKGAVGTSASYMQLLAKHVILSGMDDKNSLTGQESEESRQPTTDPSLDDRRNITGVSDPLRVTNDRRSISPTAAFEASIMSALKPGSVPCDHPDLPAQAGLPRHLRAGRAGRIPIQIRVRPARAPVAAHRRMGRTVCGAPGGLQRDAVQAQSHQCGKHRQPGACPGRAAAHRVGQRRPQPAGTHPGRLGQPPQPASGGISDRR